MRKVLFFLSVSILFFMPILKADTQSSPKKIVIFKIPDRLPRTGNAEEIQCYYYETEALIQSKSLVDLGTIQITASNTTTGETWSDVFDSSQETPHLLDVSNESGNYTVTYTTESGDVYEGTFEVSNVLSVITYVYDAAGNRIGRGV